MATVTKSRPWQDVAKEARDHRDASIALVEPALPQVPDQLPLDVSRLPSQLLSQREIDITETAAEDLVVQLASGVISCVEVTNAFLRRAGIAQRLTNCITELLPERALARAKSLDDYYALHRRTVGPLHGLPISVKEHVGMQGLRLNAGVVSFWDTKAEEDAHILKILWNAGAVFHARTTEPQTLMHLETSSNLYGQTVNPFNRILTSGGSSGGEGALLGLRGSCLGIGTDIGGSIRSPAANNGLYGFRPTSFRLPLAGLAMPMAGSDHIIPVIGPLSTSLEGIKVFMRTIIAAKPWLYEPSLLPLPWKEGAAAIEPGSKLKVAVLWDDGVVKPHPPVTRALREVSERLKALPNVEVVDWEPYEHEEAWSIIASLYFCDGAAEETASIDASGEPWLPLSTNIIKDNPYVKRHTMEELWFWQGKREAYRSEYARRWNETGRRRSPTAEPEEMVDVILCPVGPSAAPLLNTAKWWGYTSQWNLLDYPALVFPVSKVDPTIDLTDRSYTPRNEKDRYNWDLYDPETFKAGPVSLQLVGRRYEDEKVLAAMDLIEGLVGLPFVSFT